MSAQQDPQHQFRITAAPTPVDLAEINSVIAQSIQSWPTSERLKRLAMAPLQYRQPDLQDFEFLMCYKAHACLGIAAWQPNTPLSLGNTMVAAGRLGSENTVKAALLHGLFVNAQAQARGIGGLLLDEFIRQARQRGFAGIFVRAERFSTSYFEHKGFHQLDDGEEPGLIPEDYPHRYLLAVS
jgi:GNAT superfamily N-acetyltransferase